MIQNSSLNYDYEIKFIIIGSANVGKSNILYKFINNKFKSEYAITLGLEYCNKNIKIKNKNYKAQIWDTAGQENFQSITRAYYANCACAIMVYDITNKNSFNNISFWKEECETYSPKDILLVLVGNKSDLKEKREVSIEEGKELANKYGMLFYETSAKDGTNVESVFYESINIIAEKIEKGYYDFESDCGIKKGFKSKERNKNQNKNRRYTITSEKSKKKKTKKRCCK